MEYSTSNKLCNATGFWQELEYSSGVSIKVPPDGFILLSVNQMEDFAKEKPGSEEAKEQLLIRGLFLDDNTREYDIQALEALERCVALLKERYNAAVSRLQDLCVLGNISADADNPQFQNRLKTLGLEDLNKRIKTLEKRIQILKAETKTDDMVIVRKLNPELTCFVLDPPREFPSKTALKIFLEEHPDVKKKHIEFMKQQKTE